MNEPRYTLEQMIGPGDRSWEHMTHPETGETACGFTIEDHPVLGPRFPDSPRAQCPDCMRKVAAAGEDVIVEIRDAVPTASSMVSFRALSARAQSTMRKLVPEYERPTSVFMVSITVAGALISVLQGIGLEVRRA